MMNCKFRRIGFSPRRPSWHARWLRALATAAFSISLIVMGVGSGPRQAAAQAQPPSGAPPAAPRPAPLDRNAVLILVRSTLLALHHGNETGNYTVLRDLGSPSFQAVNTAARLAEIFAGLRNGRVELTSVAVLEPQITQGPQIEQDNLLRVAGFFSAGEQQLNFELAFQPVNGRFKLFGISTNLSQPGAATAANPSSGAKDQAASPAPAGAAKPANPAPKP